MMADLILYRRMRGLFWGGLVAVVIGIPSAILLGIGLFIELSSNVADDTIRDFGGPTLFMEGGFGVLTLLGPVVALLFGATAGSVDAQRGVLRDLVLTGRPRIVIALRRMLGAYAWVLLGTAVSVGLVTLIALALAPVEGSMDWGRWGENVLVLLPPITTALLIGAGLAMLIGSRGPAVIVYFVFTLVIDNILTVIPKVGEWWEHASLNVAEQQVLGNIAPEFIGTADRVNSLGVAYAVYVAWATIPVIAGLIRLQRRDL